jgi:hypothetical protein
MSKRKARRTTRVLSPRQEADLRRNRRRIAGELADLTARNQMRKEAGDEPTLSGELRRAIHASPLSLTDIAAQAGVPPVALDEFLTGERTLRSDVLDRLTRSLGLVLTSQN